MRNYLYLLLIFLATAIPAAADEVKMRAATRAEILQHLPGARRASETYQVSVGKICVRYQSGQTDCVKILTDGRRLQMIDSGGGREWID